MPLGGLQPGSSHPAAGAARILLALAVVLVAVVLAAVPLIDRYVLTPERVRTTLVPILEARLGRSIRIEDAAVSWRGLSLTGVAIAEDAAYARSDDAAVVRADRVVLLINPLSLRHRELRIEQLYLDGPAFTVARAADGTWNLATFGRDDASPSPTEPDTEPNPAAADADDADDDAGWRVHLNRIRIKHGTLTFFDAHEFLPDKPLWAQLDEIDLRTSPGADDGVVNVDMAARLRGSDKPDPGPDEIKLDIPLTLRGPLEYQRMNATFAVDAEEVDVDAIVHLLRKDPARPRTKRERKQRPPSLFSFDLNVDNVLYQGYHFEAAHGRIALADLGVVDGAIDADLAGGTVNVTAKFDFSGDGISVSGLARGDGVGAGAVLQRLRTAYLPTLQGTADLVLTLDGHADRLGEAFKAAVPARRPSTGGSLHARAVFHVDEIDIDRGYEDVMRLLGHGADSPDGPDTPQAAELPPVNFEGFEITATIGAERATMQGINFADLVIEESFIEGKNAATATAHSVHQGDAKIKFDIDFDHHDLPYAGQLQFQGLDVVSVLNEYTQLTAGNTAGRLDVDLDLAGSLFGVRENILATLLAISAQRADSCVAHARLDLDLERLDLEALLGHHRHADHDAAPSPDEDAKPSRTFGPYDTGDLQADLDLTVGETALFGYVFRDLDASAKLGHSMINVSKLAGAVAGGTFELETTIGLDYPGLVYEGWLDVVSADIPALVEPFRLESFGEPVGVTNITMRFDGSGTSSAQALEALSAEINLDVPAGRLRNSEMFRQIEKTSGIPGFHDFQVKNSGGKIIIAGGRATSDHLLIGGEEARIVGDGKIEFDGTLDFELALGVGPTSRRRLLAPGIVLPYSVDKDGWTNMPLILQGRLGDPTVRVPPEAYAGTALRAAPDAAGRLISEGVGAAGKGGGRVLKGGASAVGAMFGGIGSALAGDGDQAEHEEQAGQAAQAGQAERAEQEERREPEQREEGTPGEQEE